MAGVVVSTCPVSCTFPSTNEKVLLEVRLFGTVEHRVSEIQSSGIPEFLAGFGDWSHLESTENPTLALHFPPFLLQHTGC